MRPIVLIAILVLFTIGCTKKQDTPQSRFKTFINAVLDENRALVEDSFSKNSLKLLSIKPMWFNLLVKDTKKDQPKFLRFEFLKRHRYARVYYSFSNGKTDWLIMVNKNSRWYIEMDLKKHIDSKVLEFKPNS